MRAGQLRHLVDIQRATKTSDDYGQPVLTWKTIDTRHAAIIPLTGREGSNAKAIAATATHTIKLRHFDLTSQDRIKWGDRIFNLVSVLDTEERDRETVILAVESLC